MADTSIQLKSTKIMVMVLELDEASSGSLNDYIDNKVAQTPQFFDGASLILDVSALADDTCIPFVDFLQHCKGLGINTIGFTGASVELGQRLNKLGLPSNIEMGRQKYLDLKLKAEPAVLETASSIYKSPKVITRPVRSGQQVYAEGCDLYIHAQVSEGAEILADGNIYVRGALRGRAFAGINGFDDARIFCDQLQAEIVSISGHFLMSDNFPEGVFDQPAQILLDNDKVVVSKL